MKNTNAETLRPGMGEPVHTFTIRRWGAGAGDNLENKAIEEHDKKKL